MKSVKQILENQPINETVIINGWVKARRDTKSFSFIEINDGSCFNNIQVIAKNDLENYAEVLTLNKDCSVQITGMLVETKTIIEVVATSIVIFGLIDSPDKYEMSAKKHTIEHLRENAHLRIRTNLISAITRIRNTISIEIHKYFQSNEFYWIHTPIITSGDCEGAGELFRIKTASGEEFFNKPAYLTVSGQLNVESYCLGMKKVYTFGPTFRAENSNTTRHLSEFWMVEPEIAFADLSDNISVAISMLLHVFTKVLEKHQDELVFCSRFFETDVIKRLEHVIEKSFITIDYTEAVKILIESKQQFENTVSWGLDLASEHERYICEVIFNQPVIIINYPKKIKAFYMRQNDDNKTVAAMDILVPGIGEIVGGSQREERYDVLIKRMNELNIDINALSWYLDLRRYGTVKHSGFGLGLERLVSYMTGATNIRDVIPFPRFPKQLEY